jgi:hypothetical protein
MDIDLNFTKKMVDLSIEFFMSFMDANETLFIVKIEKKIVEMFFVMKDLTEYFTDNFNLHALKKKKNERQVKGNEKTFLEEGVFIIVINNEEEEETNELETLIVIQIDIQEFKAKATMS